MIPIDDDIRHIVEEGGAFQKREDRLGRIEYAWIELAGYALYAEHTQKKDGQVNTILEWIEDPQSKQAYISEVVTVVER